MRARLVRSCPTLVFVLAALLGVACDPGSTPPRSCSSGSDCAAGRACVDGRCVVDGRDAAGTDAGGALDSGGSTMDDAGEVADSGGGGGGFDAGPLVIPDEDGDGISDAQEGRALGTDTDGDGVPDYQDGDSDGDGILDSIEAGDLDPSTAPFDSDGDGFPDFRDLDSDGNNVMDAVEGIADVDGDGRLNYRDLDNDNDGILDRDEAGPDPASPVDTDGDGLADMNDLDSDGDFISDVHEDVFDTDRDGILDRVDLDSDGDGLLDAEEAGDSDLATPPVDTDGDGDADFRDADSDDDGLSDAAERAAGTSPVLGDTDGDGVSDLIEVGAGTSPTNPADSPRTRGDFVFLVPYMAPPDPTRDTLQFSTSLQRADVFFLMDNTGSMGGTIAALQSGLTSTVIPSIVSSIPEAWFGVGGFDDYPLGTYGNDPVTCGSYYGTGSRTDSVGIAHDVAFFQYATMSNVTSTISTAVGRYQVNCGNDGPESGVAALYALASRNTLGGYARFATGTSVSTSPPSCAAGFRGSACFRPDAVPIVIVMTDVNQHNDPTCGCNYTTTVPGGGPSWAATVSALSTLNARVVGIATSTGANAFLQRLVTDTTIARGAPGAATEYVVSAPGGTGLSSAIATLVRRAAQVPLDVSARAVDLADPGETVDAVAAFVDHLEPNVGGAPGLTCTSGFATSDYAGIDGDAFPDTFLDVTPGAPVCFDILPRMNVTVPPTLSPQIFRARINVLGDGFTPLDSRVVYFLVPPRIPAPGT